MKKTLMAAIAVALLAMVAVLLHSRSKAPDVPDVAAAPQASPVPEPTAQPPTVAVAVPAATPVAPSASNAAPAKPLAPLASLTPKLAQIRAETAKDPHTTPPSLLRFGTALEDRMERASGSEAQARALFGELEACIHDPDQKDSHSVQALCYLNAHRLAERYPGALEARFRDLSGYTSREAKRRAQILF